MEKIKVLHISETFASGVYTYIKQVCQFLAKDKGFEIYVAYSNERIENEQEDVILQEFPSNVTFFKLNLHREISPISDFKGVLAIRNLIKKIKPNIVHLHSSKAGILGRISSLGLKKDTCFFYTPHGYSFIREDISKNKQCFFYNIEKYITKLFGGVILACGDSEYELAKIFSKSVVLVRNGINIKLIESRVSEISTKQSKDRHIIGTCGRICIQKNPSLFNKIALSMPDYTFIWIGEGEMRSELTSSNIIVTGWKTHSEVIMLLSKLDVFLSTSLWEGLPFNILEAMALKKPIVSNNIKGNSITVKNSENGFLCNKEFEFVNGIMSCIENNSTYGNASYTRVNELFDIEKNLQNLKEVYLRKFKQ